MTFDINARMNQWTTANAAQHTDEIESILKTGGAALQEENKTSRADNPDEHD